MCLCETLGLNAVTYVYTILPQIMGQVFITFQRFLGQVTKRDRCLLSEGTRAVYNL